MRYKVSCMFSGYDGIYYDEKAWKQVRLILKISEHSQGKHFSLAEGETRVFYIQPIANVVSYSGPGIVYGNYYVRGMGEFPQVQVAMTMVNGEIAISVKPFSYSVNDISWKVTGDTGYDYKLENDLSNSQWDDYLNPRFIENYFRKNITVEEIED